MCHIFLNCCISILQLPFKCFQNTFTGFDLTSIIPSPSQKNALFVSVLNSPLPPYTPHCSKTSTSIHLGAHICKVSVYRALAVDSAEVVVSAVSRVPVISDFIVLSVSRAQTKFLGSFIALLPSFRASTAMEVFTFPRERDGNASQSR